MPYDLSYGLVLNTHITLMVSTIMLVIAADVMALLWWRGKIETLPSRTIQTLHWLIFVGLALSIATGGLMASTAFSYLLSQPAFVIKMLFVSTLLVNAIIIHRHLSLAITHPYSNLPNKTKRTLFISGAVSTTSWVCVLLASQFFVL